MTRKVTLELNALETSRFGMVAAHLTNQATPLAEVNDTAAGQGVRMIVTRVSTTDLARVQKLEADGYRLMDTLVWYGRDLTDLPDPAPSPGGEVIRLATPQDRAAVAAVSACAFQGYFGHYHADARLDDTAADDVYVDWASRSTAASADPRTPVLVAEQGGRIVAFSTLRLNSDTEIEIVLNGVHPDVQRGGLYGRMIDRGMRCGLDLGCTRVTLSTQIINIPVQKAWARRGFRLERSLYTLHKWFD